MKNPGNYLVTGGAGFIGSHLCENLLSAGHTVTCVDNFSTGRRENIAHLPNLRVIEADTNEEATWDALPAEHFDAIFHYAATVGVKRTEENPELVLRDIRGLQLLANFARKISVGHIIFSSSSEVYGLNPHIPSTEQDGVIAWSPYTTVKRFGEQILQALWTQHGIPTTSLRFFNVYGPRQAGTDYGFVVSRFMEQVLEGSAPTVFGTGTQTRDFVAVADNIAAALGIVNQPAAYGEIFNVGTGVETSIVDLAQLVIAAAGKNTTLAPKFLSGRDVEVARRCADTSHLHTTVGVECNTMLAEGIYTLLPVSEPQVSSELVTS